MIELRQLQYFLAVAEQLNFSKAAKMLYVTQPLLSQQIAELEKQLNATLFHRTRRTVSLSPAGMALVQEANVIVNRVNNLSAVVQRANSRDGLEITMNIGFELLFERTRLTQEVLKFHRQNPSFHCNMTCYTYGKLMQALNEGEIDIAFTLTPNKALAADVITYPLWEDRLVGVVSKELFGCLTLEEFFNISESMPLLLINADPRGMNDIVALCKNIGILPQLQLLNDVHEVLMNVEGGNGFSILPASFVHTYNSPFLSTVELEGYEEARLIPIACQNHSNNNPIAPIFLNSLRS